MRAAQDAPVPSRGGLLALTVYALAGACWAASPGGSQYPAIPVVLIELFVATLLFPAARISLRAPLTPMSWALFLFHVHLVAAPLLGVMFGFHQGTLPGLPSSRFINLAMLVSALAHLCFAAGAELASRRRSRPQAPAFAPSLTAALVWGCACLGAVGFALRFGGLGGYWSYVTVPEAQLELSTEPATLSGALGTLLRPFLPFSFILLWSNHVSSTRSGRRHLGATLLLLLVLLPVTASYNRASMVGPALAVLAAYSMTVRRLSFRTVALIGVGLLLAGIAFGTYRGEHMPGAVRAARAAPSIADKTNEFLQVYGEGPQFLGFLLERTRGEELHLGRTLLASALYPIPVLGKPFRERSGVNYYNRLIYGVPGVVDQIIPASGELLLNFHLLGPVLFFGLLGYAVRRLHDWFTRTTSAFEAASAFYVGMWVAFPICGSVAVLSQIFIYSFWPVYAYFGLKRALAATRVRLHRSRRDERASLAPARRMEITA